MTGALYLAICIATWGMAMFCMKIAGSRLDPMTVAAFNMFGYLSVGAFLFPRANFAFGRYHIVAILIGALYVLGNMAFYKLSQTAQVSTLAPATSLAVALPILLGVALLHEPLTSRKLAGILLALVSIYLLSSTEEVG